MLVHVFEGYCCESIEIRRPFMKAVALDCMVVLHVFTDWFFCCSWEWKDFSYSVVSPGQVAVHRPSQGSRSNQFEMCSYHHHVITAGLGHSSFYSKNNNRLLKQSAWFRFCISFAIMFKELRFRQFYNCHQCNVDCGEFTILIAAGSCNSVLLHVGLLC